MKSKAWLIKEITDQVASLEGEKYALDRSSLEYKNCELKISLLGDRLETVMNDHHRESGERHHIEVNGVANIKILLDELTTTAPSITNDQYEFVRQIHSQLEVLER